MPYRKIGMSCSVKSIGDGTKQSNFICHYSTNKIVSFINERVQITSWNGREEISDAAFGMCWLLGCFSHEYF